MSQLRMNCGILCVSELERTRIHESSSHSHYNPTVVHYTYLFVHLLFMRKSEYAFKFNYKV